MFPFSSCLLKSGIYLEGSLRPVPCLPAGNFDASLLANEIAAAHGACLRPFVTLCLLLQGASTFPR